MGMGVKPQSRQAVLELQNKVVGIVLESSWWACVLDRANTFAAWVLQVSQIGKLCLAKVLIVHYVLFKIDGVQFKYTHLAFFITSIEFYVTFWVIGRICCTFDFYLKICVKEKQLCNVFKIIFSRKRPQRMEADELGHETLEGPHWPSQPWSGSGSGQEGPDGSSRSSWRGRGWRSPQPHRELGQKVRHPPRGSRCCGH